MARLFTSASSEYAEYTSGSPVTAAPLTMACWFRPADDTTRSTLINLVQSADDTHRWTLEAAGNVAGDTIRYFAVAGGANSVAITTTGFTANTWHHCCAVEASSSDRRVFIDGGSKGTQTASRVPASINRITVGAFRSGASNSLHANGRIAEAAIWNVALTDSEVLALARGVHPLDMRPANLVAYWPLLGNDSPERDIHPRSALVTSFPLTLNGTTKANHAPVALHRQYRRTAGGVLVPDTSAFTATAALSVAPAVASGTAARIPPFYTGTGIVTVGATTLSASGTFVAPVYTASGSLSSGAATLAATGVFTSPAYTGSGSVSVGAATVSASATHTPPIYVGVGAFIVGAATVSGSATFTVPTYTGVGTLTVAAATTGIVGLFIIQPSIAGVEFEILTDALEYELTEEQLQYEALEN